MAIGGFIGNIGKALNLPEFGVSEFVSGVESADVDVLPFVGRNTGQSLGQIATGSASPQTRLAGVGFGPSQMNPNGTVLSDTTSRNPNQPTTLPTSTGAGAGTGQPSQGFLQSLLNQAGQGIQQGYDATIGQLNANRGFLEGQGRDMIGQTDTMYGQQRRGFESQRGEAMSDLDRSQQDIEANKTDALSDLSSDLRAQMESFTRMLGAMGAADSSAAGMGQYAYGRMGQQARSDIWKQANQLYSEVGVRREKVNNLFNENMRQLGDWKVNQLANIENQLKEKMAMIDQQKMQADQSRLAQLNDIQMQIQQQALSTALQVDQRVSSVASANQQWAQSQAQTLDSLRGQLEQSLAAINLPQVAADPLASTAVNNGFNFGAGDIQRGGQAQGPAQVALPTNRRDERTI